MLLKDLIYDLRGRLAPKFGGREASAMVGAIFSALKGWDAVQLAVRGEDEVSDYIVSKTRSVVARVLADEPLQYVLGVAPFYGMDFHVTPSTLIPRPETAALVDMIVKENPQSDLRVLDLGTGSGCIAVALSRNLRFAKVTAVDVSADALAVARENAARLKVDVDMRLADMLADDFYDTYDIIVSNPPYIAESESADMEAMVLDHEPGLALFVPDDDPLKFYRAIARIASRSLVPGGRLYLEINPRFASLLSQMLTRYDLEDIEIHRDIERRQRFITARRIS